MPKEMNIEVLEIKSLTHFIAKELDSKQTEELNRFEERLQKAYKLEEFHNKQDLGIGSYVCVYCSPNPQNKRSLKKWLRGVVRNVLITIGSHLYNVYLLDYGSEVSIEGSSVRPIRSHFTNEFMKYQIIDFHLLDIEVKPNVDSEDKSFVEQIFKANNNTVSALILKETNTNLFGTIKLNDGKHLDEILVSKGLADYKSKTKTPINGFDGNNSHHLKQRNNSMASISSVSSTKLSIESKSSTESIENLPNGNNICEKHKMAKMVHKINGFDDNQKSKAGGKLSQMFTKIKIKKQESLGSNGDSNGSNDNSGGSQCSVQSDNRSESPIDFTDLLNSKPVEEEVDWPDPQTSRRSLGLCPAGFHPSLQVVERIYTLKKRDKQLDL